MSDVAGVCSAPIVGEARARGIDPLPLVAGLGTSLADFEDPRGRVPWHAFVPFMERAAKMLGEETLEELAADATVRGVPDPVRRLLPWLGDSRRLFRLAARWCGPWVFHGTRARCEVLPDGRLREIVQILPEYPACPEFLSGITGSLRAMPRLLDQSDALVTLEQDGREGEFLITPPRPRAPAGWSGLRQRVWRAREPDRNALRTSLSVEPRLEELDRARAQLRASRRSVESATARLDQQAHCLGTLQQLGLTIVHDGDLDALQQDIVCLVQQQLGVLGARLSLDGVEGESDRAADSGFLSASPEETWPLRIGDRTIGRLELWGVGSGEELTPIHDLLPWIAISLENGRSKRLAAQLLMLLADDVRDWESMERRLERALLRDDDARSLGRARPAWPMADLERIDLTQFLRTLLPELKTLVGDDVDLTLRCDEGLWPALFERDQLEAFVEHVVEILCDIGCEQISIDAHAVAEQATPDLRLTTAEILVRGRGSVSEPVPEASLRAALEVADSGILIADVDAPAEADGAVGVCVRLPLLTPATGETAH